MATIALDATYSQGENLSGVGVYSRELLRGLAQAQPEREFLFCYRPHRFLPSLGERLPGNASRRLILDGWVPRSACLFHGLGQRLPKARLRHTVATFHDLFVLTAEYSTAEFRRRFAAQARDAAERAERIIAVSQATARQVQELLRVETARIRVVPHGVHLPPEPPGEAREKMVLHVGAIQKRKNLVRLVQAFERLDAGWRLTLAGSMGYGAEEILEAILQSPRRADIVLLGWVQPAELARLYARASIFAFPSLDEGFGMPVLEAMAWRVPVLTSNRSALPEVAGDAALLIDPENVDSIAAGLCGLASDHTLRRELVVRGMARAAEFTWPSAVAKTWAVYCELCSELRT